MKMVSVAKAEKLIAENMRSAPISHADINDPREEVLTESLVADRNYPPFHRVAMDGIAIRFDQWEQGRRSFTVEGIQKAGEAQKELVSSEACLEVMTGAPLPEGTDTVIRYEDIEISQAVAKISEIQLKHRQNIHFEAADYKKGEVLVTAPAMMRAPEWSVAASVGTSRASVFRRPKIAVVSTGDELVDVGKVPSSHQIRLSNAHALKSSLLSHGFTDVEIFHLKDEESKIHRSLESVFEKFDWVFLSGGVSMGKFDFVPQVLNDLGVREVFHKVTQKPGKPMWFGVKNESQPVFGLPGNPVSALVCLHRYALPALYKSLNIAPRSVYAVLDDVVEFKKDLTFFASVKVKFTREGRIAATPVRNNGSGDFASLTKSDGFIELPAEKEKFEKGESYPLYLWRALC